MKDGTGEGFTRADHPDLSNQLFASYSEVASARSLATVIGEDELSEGDKLSLKFGNELEKQFITQGMYEDRSIQATLDLGWKLLSILPRDALSRVSDKVLDEHYVQVEHQAVSGACFLEREVRAWRSQRPQRAT